jgi:hypothetical protein
LKLINLKWAWGLENAEEDQGLNIEAVVHQGAVRLLVNGAFLYDPEWRNPDRVLERLGFVYSRPGSFQTD